MNELNVVSAHAFGDANSLSNRLFVGVFTKVMHALSRSSGNGKHFKNERAWNE